MLYPEGLTNRNGNKLAKSTVERMFKNIFYIGQFEFKGFVCTNAQHEGIIDIDTFNAIQERLGGVVRARTHDVQFPYQGLFRCGMCGGLAYSRTKEKEKWQRVHILSL
ncbi:MAG: recombinase family protein [Cyanobacteriota bacterium]|nr:recombinase family protein [Cyanobacteriota bacterium]